MSDKKISINKIDKILGVENLNKTTTIPFEINESETVDIEVASTISFEDFHNMVTEIVDDCFEYRDERCTYFASLKECTFRANIMKYFTNLKTGFNQEKMYSLTLSTLYSKIESAINPNQLKDIKNAVEEQLEYRKRDLLFKYEKELNTAISNLTSLLSMFDQVQDDFDIEQFENLAKKLNNISDDKVVEILRDKVNTDNV